jgi:alpha-L-arabinofuranosidase
MLGIGNEQWGPQYIERLARFIEAIKARHPDIQLIASCGPEPADARFEYLWPKFRELNVDIVDEHCYARPSWFFENTHRYDAYDRNGPKVFFGEYAAQSDKMVSVENVNNLECALSEAAFMIGLERNADVVRLASYAPLFAHKDAWQWTPDLIWVDNLSVVRTPNYYVQQLFSHYRGDWTLPTEITTQDAAQPIYANATRDDQNGIVILKVVNPGDAPAETQIAIADAIQTTAREIVLAASGLAQENTFASPSQIRPEEVVITLAGNTFTRAFRPQSLTILLIKFQ